jgi:hypothetical protein
MEHVRTLKSIQRAEKELVGQRGVDLALLLEKGYDIPLSFLITNACFEGFIEHNKLQQQIATSLMETSNPDKRYERIRELLLNGTFPNEMVREIVESYQSLGVEMGDSINSIVAAEEAPFVTVILSPNYVVPEENTEGIIINVRGLEELLLAVKECWACLFTPRMQRFREEAGIGNRNLNVGILIQHMPHGEISGESWSATKNKADELTVKTYYGALDIGHHVEKDEFRLAREYLKPVYQSVAVQSVMLARDEEDRLGKVPIGTRGEEQKLNDRTVIELGRLAKKASGILDCHVKLSFNIDDEKIQTMLCDRLILTKGAVKLQSYEAEERIEEPLPEDAMAIKEAASVQVSKDTHVEEADATVEVDDETGEEKVVMESVTEDDEPVEEDTPEEVEEETGVVEPTLEDVPEQSNDLPTENPEPVELETEESITEESEATIEADSDTADETDTNTADETDTNTADETDTNTADETDFFATITDEPGVVTETDEAIIAVDPESEEAEVVSETHTEEVTPTQESIANEPENVETAEDIPGKEDIEEATVEGLEDEEVEEETKVVEPTVDEELEDEEPTVANEPELVEETEEQAEQEPEAEEKPVEEQEAEEDVKEAETQEEDVSDDSITFDEAWRQITEALFDRYEARFRNPAPQTLTELFFELSNEIIIPHEGVIGKAVKAYEEEELDQELEEQVMAILDEFLAGIR